MITNNDLWTINYLSLYLQHATVAAAQETVSPETMKIANIRKNKQEGCPDFLFLFLMTNFQIERD